MSSRGLASKLRLTSAQVLPPHDLPVIAGPHAVRTFQRTFLASTVAFLDFVSDRRCPIDSENATLVFFSDRHTTRKVKPFCDSVVIWAIH
jgi:hypothetical protein